MGTGLDSVYPPEHGALAERIVTGGGALLGEFPPGTPAHAANFPRRNRLISGLSLGTLVIEAAQRSGSLITARLAGEQGREVFAVPGAITNPVARGCHALIRQGARLVEEPAEVLAELNIPYSNQPVTNLVGPVASTPVLDNDHKILLDALGFEPTSLDSLVERTGLSSQCLASMLLMLELEGRVGLHPGGRYLRLA
jgi:DNA processing protein